MLQNLRDGGEEGPLAANGTEARRQHASLGVVGWGARCCQRSVRPSESRLPPEARPRSSWRRTSMPRHVLHPGYHGPILEARGDAALVLQLSLFLVLRESAKGISRRAIQATRVHSLPCIYHFMPWRRGSHASPCGRQRMNEARDSHAGGGNRR